MLLQAVDLAIVARVLHFLRVHVDAETEAALAPELDEITADSTKGVQNICLAIRHSILRIVCVHEALVDLGRDVFCHGLRCDRVPRLVIDEDTAIKLAKEIITARPELLELFVLRIFHVRIDKVIPLGALVSVMIFPVCIEYGFGALQEHDDVIVASVSRGGLVQLELHLVKWEALDGQHLFLIPRSAAFIVVPSTLII